LGYGPHESSLEAFLGSIGSPCFASFGYASGLTVTTTDLPVAAGYTLTPVLPLTGGATFLRHPLAWLLPVRVPRSAAVVPEGTPAGSGGEHHRVHHGRAHAGTGISTRCPSTTPVGLVLGPDLPWADEPGPGTLGHSAEEFLTPLSLLMPAFSLVRRPRLDHSAASTAERRSPTRPNDCAPTRRWLADHEFERHGFGGVLEPRYIVGAESLDQ
jgi:hypothetical protein